MTTFSDSLINSLGLLSSMTSIDTGAMVCFGGPFPFHFWGGFLTKAAISVTAAKPPLGGGNSCPCLILLRSIALLDMELIRDIRLEFFQASDNEANMRDIEMIAAVVTKIAKAERDRGSWSLGWAFRDERRCCSSSSSSIRSRATYSAWSFIARWWSEAKENRRYHVR
jgi:hypothetical protein